MFFNKPAASASGLFLIAGQTRFAGNLSIQEKESRICGVCRAIASVSFGKRIFLLSFLKYDLFLSKSEKTLQSFPP